MYECIKKVLHMLNTALKYIENCFWNHIVFRISLNEKSENLTKSSTNSSYNIRWSVIDYL